MAKLLVMLGSKIDCGVQFLLHPHSVPVVMKSPKPLLASPLNQSEFGSVTTNPPTIVRPAGARQKRAPFLSFGQAFRVLESGRSGWRLAHVEREVSSSLSAPRLVSPNADSGRATGPGAMPPLIRVCGFARSWRPLPYVGCPIRTSARELLSGSGQTRSVRTRHAAAPSGNQCDE